MSKVFDDDAKFDRLVDGELSAEEYRELVASLDDEPSGWRRCALAFLESQALAGEISGVRRGMTLSDDDNNPPAEPPIVAQGAARKHKTGAFRLTTILAMAASFLVAFGLGIAMPRWFPVGSRAPVVGGISQHAPPVTNVATNSSPGPGNGSVRREAFKPIGNVQLMVDGPGGDSMRVGDVPVFEAADSAAEWPADERPALSPQILQVLQDRGHKIERQIEYVPVQLDDGRQVIIPIERYQIRLPDRLPY